MGRSPIYSKTERAFLATGYVVTAYIAVSLVVFSFRHPWMTDTERFVHTIDALMWRVVPYHDARPR